MNSKFAGLVIFTTLIFTYVLVSPFISNLEYKNLETKGMQCDADLTYACFLNMDVLCFEYVSPCTIPDGWVVRKTPLSAVYSRE